MGKLGKNIFTFVFVLVAVMTVLIQASVTSSAEATERGSFMWSKRGSEPIVMKIVTKPESVAASIDRAAIVLEDEEWKAEVYISSTLASRYRANVTHYKEGKPLPWRIELIVDGFFPEFDIDYLDKTTNERTERRKFLVSQYVESEYIGGLDFGEYMKAAQEIDEVAPPVSRYSVGRITIVNKKTSAIGNRYTYDESRGEYVEDIDVDIHFDISIDRSAKTTETTETTETNGENGEKIDWPVIAPIIIAIISAISAITVAWIKTRK